MITACIAVSRCCLLGMQSTSRGPARGPLGGCTGACVRRRDQGCFAEATRDAAAACAIVNG
jgi:hypothetical protein